MASLTDPNSDLINALQKLSISKPKLVKGNTRKLPNDPEIQVTSWKMNEFKYTEVPCPFPTLARGLFTRELAVEGESAEGQDEGPKKYGIVARGYDKFFNIGEVRWNTWKSIETYTESPYVLTLKSNGCIIFIAPISPSQLVVTSKHSLGATEGNAISHAQMGQKWLNRHVESKGKTEAELAAELWKRELTAVAELCDDSFEEHVLGYPVELSGLHLHGLNKNAGAFETLPMTEVESFAHVWGFIPTPFFTLDSAQFVKEFTDEAAKTGKWNGVAIEGFVVRTKVKSLRPPTPPRTDRHDADRPVPPPYPPGSDYFFKVKFDEPYMMYRDWREMTRMLLSKLGTDKASTVPKSKLKRPESRIYRRWVQKEMVRDLAAFEGFQEGHGIIAVRERFLKWLEEKEGVEELEKEQSGQREIVARPVGEWRKTVIVPIGIPGCGKTSIGLVLCRLFGFGHTQSDDVTAKKAAPKFESNISDLLREFDVVFADRNNHLKQHREGIRNAVTRGDTRHVRLLALNWDAKLPSAMTHRLCSDRITLRGENHQSLLADPAKNHEEIIWRFINDAEPLEEGEVDETIEMDIEDDLEAAVNRAVPQLAKILGIAQPDSSTIKTACVEAIESYKPKLAPQGKKTKASMKSPRYFGFLPEANFSEMIDEALHQDGVPESLKTFWAHLEKNKRVASRPHITIVHSQDKSNKEDLWDRCSSLRNISLQPVFKFRLDQLVYNDRVISIHVEDITVADNASAAEGTNFLESIPDDVRKRFHITVGTRGADVPAIEGKHIIEGWKKGEEGIACLRFGTEQEVDGRLAGLFS